MAYISYISGTLGDYTNVGYTCHWGTSFFEDVPLVEVMYLVHTCQVKVTVGDSGLCSCICVTYFER